MSQKLNERIFESRATTGTDPGTAAARGPAQAHVRIAEGAQGGHASEDPDWSPGIGSGPAGAVLGRGVEELAG